MKINKHIEIVRSSVVSLSSLSDESCRAIFAVLTKHYSNVGVTIVNTQADLDQLAASQPDLVFLGMKFVPSEANDNKNDSGKVWVAEYLDRHEIAYTGSNHQAHTLELDKSLAKQRVQQNGLNTSPFYVVSENGDTKMQTQTLNFPLFVKPVDRGGGLGIDNDSVVCNQSQLNAKVQSIKEVVGSNALVEEYLTGREFSVAILQDTDSAQLSVMPIELVTAEDRGVRILSAEVKTGNVERAIAVPDSELRTKVTTLAADVFQALGARDYGRIDIRLDKKGEPQFLEANLLPSLISGYGSFPKACMLNQKLDYELMLLQIVNLAFGRNLQFPTPLIFDTPVITPA